MLNIPIPSLLFTGEIWGLSSFFHIDTSDGGRRGKKSKHREFEVSCLQMARVGVYWQEHQNISAVSSGTQTTDCDWPDHSQEWKHGSLQYNRGWRESKRDPQQMWHYSPHN